MEQRLLERRVEELQAIYETTRSPCVQRLLADIREHYQTPYGAMGRRCRTAWDEVVHRRLTAMRLPGGAAAATETAFATTKAQWRAATSSTALRIHFGQMRVGPAFQGNAGGGNVAQANIVGFPEEIIGRPLPVVAGMLANGEIAQDQIPVHIFWSETHQAWIAANNRGYTAACLAGVRPTRLIPREPSVDEENRLNEVEGVGTVGTLVFGGAAAGGRVGAAPRTLPSLWMPITGGPATWDVIQVARVPEEWT